MVLNVRNELLRQVMTIWPDKGSVIKDDSIKARFYGSYPRQILGLILGIG